MMYHIAQQTVKVVHLREQKNPSCYFALSRIRKLVLKLPFPIPDMINYSTLRYIYLVVPELMRYISVWKLLPVYWHRHLIKK